MGRVLCHSLGDVGVTYTVHLWLIGKRVVDFLLVLIELFRQLSRLRRYKRQETRVPALSYGVVCMILRLAVLIQYRRVTHRQTDTR